MLQLHQGLRRRHACLPDRALLRCTAMRLQGAGMCAQEIEGMEVVLVRSNAPRGVLMVFHGCMRRPTDWWHYEPTCITCIGDCAFRSDCWNLSRLQISVILHDPCCCVVLVCGQMTLPSCT